MAAAAAVAADTAVAAAEAAVTEAAATAAEVGTGAAAAAVEAEAMEVVITSLFLVSLMATNKPVLLYLCTLSRPFVHGGFGECFHGNLDGRGDETDCIPC